MAELVNIIIKWQKTENIWKYMQKNLLDSISHRTIDFDDSVKNRFSLMKKIENHNISCQRKNMMVWMQFKSIENT